MSAGTDQPYLTAIDALTRVIVDEVARVRTERDALLLVARAAASYLQSTNPDGEPSRRALWDALIALPAPIRTQVEEALK